MYIFLVFSFSDFDSTFFRMDVHYFAKAINVCSWLVFLFYRRDREVPVACPYKSILGALLDVSNLDYKKCFLLNSGGCVVWTY